MQSQQQKLAQSKVKQDKDQLLFTGSGLRRTESFLYQWQINHFRKRLNSNKLELLVEERDFLKNDVVQKIFRKMGSLVNNSVAFTFFENETKGKYTALSEVLDIILGSLSKNESDQINYEQLRRDVEKAVSDNKGAISVVRFPNFLKDLFELLGIVFSSKSETEKLCSELIKYIESNLESDKSNNLLRRV